MDSQAARGSRAVGQRRERSMFPHEWSAVLRPDIVIKRKILAAFLIASSTASAQLYDTPETRRQRADAERKAQEQRDGAAARAQGAQLNQSKEAIAQSYVGKTFSYTPNPGARRRIRFYETVPPSSHSTDPNLVFTPLAATKFVVIRALMAPPTVYEAGKDEYLLEVRFPDGKAGYVNVVGCCGLKENTYVGERLANKEYVIMEEPDPTTARLIADAERERALAEEAARAEEAKAMAARKAAERREAERKAQEGIKAAERRRQQEAREAEEKAADARRRQAIAARTARPAPRIGMTMDEIENGTNWGRPRDRNRTTTAASVREQWVYDVGRYLYFENGRLVAIQE